HEIKSPFRIALGRPKLEIGVCSYPVFPSMRGGMLDRARMEIVTNELRIGEGLGHQHGRPAMAAPDIGDFGTTLQFFDDAGERRKPIVHQIVVVAGTEKT